MASKRKASSSLVREQEPVSGANTVDYGSSRVPNQKNIDASTRTAVLEDFYGFLDDKVDRVWYYRGM
ncbi:unnamed protein product [Caenorhabditis angaria]|uniref:Uncharacterized protein n=1 Tax=Caenorhabditis angaria TaxID=860376 RepID=A0A9P1ISP1_9PELO|nr:unnamed protein product [Caenorhabditis angaria]